MNTSKTFWLDNEEYAELKEKEVKPERQSVEPHYKVKQDREVKRQRKEKWENK